MNPDVVSECRSKCDSHSKKTGEAYLACFQSCVNAPLMELVRKHYGDAAAQTCRNYHQRKLEAMYNISEKHLQQAEAMARKTPDVMFNREAARMYWRMPKSKYPPYNADGTPKLPEGIVSNTPDWAKYAAFLKGEGRDCFKYELLADAKEYLTKEGVSNVPVQENSGTKALVASALMLGALYLVAKAHA